jgi:hypothetical protein
MDKLDKIFNDQREAFDEEPSDGHLQRFETKLNQFHSKGKPTFSSWPFLKIASVLVILLLSVNLLVYLLPNKKEKKAQRFASTEMNETVNFYNTRINSGLSQLQIMAGQGIGSEQELVQLNKELDEMDHLYQDLQKEYTKNPNDERVINAMIEYYQTKLNIINTIKTDLEYIKTIKNKNHENTQL